MRTSRKLTSAVLALFALVMMSAAALAADPGQLMPQTSEGSDQKAGSILFYNFYTSGATSGNAQNTRINLTNTSSTSSAFVHLFFVADTCQIADSYICLTPNQTASFLASDVDPGVSGYVVALAVDGSTGCPAAHNFLIGDEYVKTSTGHAANLGAVAFAALYAGVLPGCDNTSTTASVPFSGTYGGYNLVPRVLAASNIPSRGDGNDTLVILNRVGGNLSTGASTLSTIFGLMYDDSESVFSFSVVGGCQLRGSLSNTFPRTTPRFETVIPAGRSGWAKVWSNAGFGLLGAIINTNPNAAANAGAFNGGRNLHALTLASETVTVPVFAPSC
ncbi:MAG: hypothetical protein SF339_00600 [Blastocatellia bacterium]|nr:hypothetical protein [Blastocatellia bacterium]